MEKKETVALVVCFLLILFLNIASAVQKTIVFDEVAYIPEGYLALTKGLFFSDDNPPLIKMLSAAPLLFLNLRLPADYYDLYLHNEFMKFGAHFLYEANHHAALITFLARLLPMMLSLVLAFFVYRWAKELYGFKAGVFALILYTFSTNILAESMLATTDFGATVFMFITLYFLWKYLKTRKWLFVFLIGLFFGLANITKLTGVFLLPIIVFFLCLDLARVYVTAKTHHINSLRDTAIRHLYALIIIGVITIVIINAGFLFQGTFTPLGKSLANDPAQYFDKEVFNSQRLSETNSLGIPLVQKISYVYMEHVPLLLPYPYLKNFVGALKKNSEPLFWGGFMNGQLNERGDNKWYYIENFFIRTPIAFLLLFVMSLFFIKPGSWRDELILLAIPIVIFGYFTQGNMWSGVRYMLPLFPFLFVSCSKITINFKKNKVVYIISMLLLVWFILASLSVFPHYLTYYNEAVGGPSQGYHYFTGAAFDIGQNLGLLAAYAEKQNLGHIKLAYFGEADPSYYDLDYEFLIYHGNLYNLSVENCEPQTGIVAASITYLQPTRELQNPYCLSWLREYNPIAKIGNTIFVYNISN